MKKLKKYSQKSLAVTEITFRLWFFNFEKKKKEKERKQA